MENKRTRRVIPKEEKIQKLQSEIAKHESKISELKAKIAEIEKPSSSMRDITRRIKESGLSPDEVMKALDKLCKKQ